MRSSLGSRALAQQAAPRHGGGLGGCWGGAELFGVTFWDCRTVWGLLSGHKGDEYGCDVVWSCPAAPQGHQMEE